MCLVLSWFVDKIVIIGFDFIFVDWSIVSLVVVGQLVCSWIVDWGKSTRRKRKLVRIFK